jgi:hypothetical protein
MSTGAAKMEDTDLERRRLVAKAVRGCNLAQTEGWAALLQLSSQAHVESAETFED